MVKFESHIIEYFERLKWYSHVLGTTEGKLQALCGFGGWIWKNGTEYGSVNFKKGTQRQLCGPYDSLITQSCHWNVKSTIENIRVKEYNYVPIKTYYGNWTLYNFKMSRNILVCLPALLVVEAKTDAKSDTSDLEQGQLVESAKGWLAE